VIAYALVDPSDYPWAMRFRWTRMVRANGDHHAYRKMRVDGRQRAIYLARELLGLAWGDPGEADHRNGNGLDNRRTNLRVISHAQNAQNRRGPQRNSTTGVRGVSRCKQTGRWSARAEMNGRYYWLGRHATLDEAEAVVVAWRQEHMPISEAS
jgi:hypothetical protein